MGIDVVINVISLFAAILGLLLTLFQYLETPKRGWMYIAIFYMTHLLSDYYWTTYTLVMGENPDVSAAMAYFGWNVGYVVLLMAVIHLRQPVVRRFFHPLMLIPIPLNIIQFTLYIQYGGLLNNIWEVTITTAIAIYCLQSILYYFKNKGEGLRFPRLHTVVLLFVCAEYGMWTSSCFTWPGGALNPYYYLSVLEAIFIFLITTAATNDYEAAGFVHREKNAAETRFQVLLQIAVTAIIFFGCLGGYYLAGFMKQTLPKGADDKDAYFMIAVTLFIISFVLVIIILVLILMTAIRYKKIEKAVPESAEIRHGRFNFVFTVFITLCLMIFSEAYTSRLFYQVSVTGLIEDGEDKAASTATELENYLGVAKSILWATADTVELMLQNGTSKEGIRAYLVGQTRNQSEQFDENFTGLYAYIYGEYMDGSGWVPPLDYNVESRDWYKAAVDARGKTIIVSPYVDAQTGEVVITICKLLNDGKKPGDYDGRQVVALDMVVNHIQDITENVNMSGKGYGMVLNEDGLIISHHDKVHNGKSAIDLFGPELMNSIVQKHKGSVKARISGQKYTLFVHPVIDQWYAVVAISNNELLHEVRSQLVVSILVSLIIFMLITFFYYLGYKNEQLNGKKMEELSITRQKQEYEARVLKLEKRAADEANKAKSRFLADMSHEIRTPINAILGMNEMVLRESKDNGIVEYARNIKVSGRNLLMLINSILDFSKIEDGKMEIVPVSYRLGQMITYLHNSINERAREKKLNLIFNIDPNLPAGLFGDDTRIDQVIMNLLTNAVKYTPEGSVTLTMKAVDRQGDNVLIYVEVKDTGMGIKESEMSKLFESFERLDVVKNRNIEGTGLGMSITTSLLKLMNSELHVESEYGKGSAFSFEILQRVEDDSPLGDYRQYVTATDDEAQESLLYAPDARILIVDDTRMNLLVATSLLKRTEIRIDTAISGEEAIALSANTQYDVILLDQRMPGMDGTETLAELRKPAKSRNTDTPVICLTADAIRGAKERLIAEGFTDYLSKPVDGRTLERMLLTYIPEEHLSSRTESTPSDDTYTKEATDSKLRQELGELGIDYDYGIQYCASDEDMYIQILAGYAEEAGERRTKLQDYYDSGDWSNYEIYIHSLKSTSRTIGAGELADIAAGLEKAAIDKNMDILSSDHKKAMDKYDALVEVISANMDISVFDDTDDDEVMEFEAQ